MNRIKINLLGTAFSIKIDEDAEYFEEILGIFQDKINIIERGGALKDPLKVSILAGLLVADDLKKERNNRLNFSVTDSEEAEEVTMKIIEKIEKSLNEN